MTTPHLKPGVDSTPETSCEKHFRQWIQSNKFVTKHILYGHSSGRRDMDGHHVQHLL